MSAAQDHNRPTKRVRPERAGTPVYLHELQPGQSVTVDVRKNLPVREKSGSYSVAAILELDWRWEDPTDEDIAYEAMRARVTGEKPEPPATHRAAYQVLWFGSRRVPRTEDGGYVPFDHKGMVFNHPVAVMGGEFLGRNAHGQLVTTGCRALAVRGEWLPFGPGTMHGLMDFPDGTDPAAFAVYVDPENDHIVSIANFGARTMTVACSAPEIDYQPE